MKRRQFLAGGVGGFLGFAARNQLAHAWLRETPRIKRCVVLWMNGGPSQFETFDPKPGTRTGGECNSIATKTPGLVFAETLPNMAQLSDDLTIMRSITSPEGEHLRAQYYLHTGYRQVPAFPRPSLGSVVAHESPESESPSFVSIGGQHFGPAYMGLKHAPFGISNIAEARDLFRQLRRRKTRVELIEKLSRDFDNQFGDPNAKRRTSMLSTLNHLPGTPFVKAFDLSHEGQANRNRYGDSDFAKGCLLAKRLLESGVSFVEVQRDGWDTHENNFRNLKQLCSDIDRPWSALLQDLKSSGLLDETLVVWMGEFGRTPVINVNAGRDHYPKVTPVVLAGAGLEGGRVLGGTNELGTDITSDAHSVPDLFATIFQIVGIDPTTEFTTSFGSPTQATEEGTVIPGVIA